MNAKHLQKLEVIDETSATWLLWGGAPFHFVNLDGAGDPPIRRISRGSPLHHGVSDRGFRLQPRTMTLSLYMRGETERETDAYREKLAYIFGPTNRPLQLKATKLDGTVRQIDCYVDGTLDFPMSKRLGTGQLVEIPLLAQDPVWYNPTKQSQTLTTFTSNVQKNVIVNSLGVTWIDWPVFYLTGPANTAIIISGATTGVIRVGTPIPAGETFVLDLRQRIVYRQSDGANRMSYLDKTTLTSFATFSMYPEKSLRTLFPGVSNTIYTMAVAFNSPTTATTFKIEWYDRYTNL